MKSSFFLLVLLLLPIEAMEGERKKLKIDVSLHCDLHYGWCIDLWVMRKSRTGIAIDYFYHTKRCSNTTHMNFQQEWQPMMKYGTEYGNFFDWVIHHDCHELFSRPKNFCYEDFLNIGCWCTLADHEDGRSNIVSFDKEYDYISINKSLLNVQENSGNCYDWRCAPPNYDRTLMMKPDFKLNDSEFYSNYKNCDYDLVRQTPMSYYKLALDKFWIEIPKGMENKTLKLFSDEYFGKIKN